MLEKALILGNYRPSYILARALAARGYCVICGLDGYDRGAEVSRYVHAIWDHAAYKGDGAFQSSLNDFCQKNPEIKVIFPVTENFIKAFAEQKLVAPGGVKIGSADDDIVRLCLDKPRLLDLAQSLQIPVAPFAVTNTGDELLEEAEKIGFPIVVRPLSSTVRLKGKKAVTCHSSEELATSYADWQDCNAALLIQRFVTGKRDNLYFAAHEGRIFRYLHAKIERTDQSDGSGLALEGITVDPCPRLESHAQKLIEAIGYSGIGCIQFLVDHERDQKYLLEINPRIAGNHALPEYAGLDLSNCLIDLAFDQSDGEVMRYGDSHLRYCWLAGECESIRLSWRTGALSFWGMMKALVSALHAWRFSDLDIALNKDDWRPGVFSLCDSLPFLGRLTRRRFEPGLVQDLLITKEWLRS